MKTENPRLQSFQEKTFNSYEVKSCQAASKEGDRWHSNALLRLEQIVFKWWALSWLPGICLEIFTRDFEEQLLSKF